MRISAPLLDKQKVVLLVDDDDDDILFIKKAFQATAPQTTLLRAKDGFEAMDILRQQAPFEQAPRPSLVLLDLNLPKMNGFEVLQAIKSDSELEEIPVVILSTSDSDHDITRCYSLGACSYVTKPARLRAYCDAIKTLCDSWLNGTSGSPTQPI